MLRSIQARLRHKTSGAFAIVASQYNARYVKAMLNAAKAELNRAGQTRVRVIRVPGAFEIPVVASRLAASAHASPAAHQRPLSAIICLGVIFQGETSHAQHIGWGVTHALAQIQTQHQVPVIHAVFVFEKEEHARARCLGKKHNRGTEAARTALVMAGVMAKME